MNKLLIFISLITLVSLKELIIIGNVRAAEMGHILMNIDYHESSISYCNILLTTEPVSYEDFNVQITAETGDTWAQFSNNNIFNSFHKQLSNAQTGAIVFLWFGINYLSRFTDIFSLFGELADKYTKLNFYALPIIGVDESACSLKNAKIQDFNEKMRARIIAAEFPNFEYLDILKDDDPTKIILEGEEVNILNYNSNGISYFRAGYNKIFKALVEALEKKESK